MLNNLRLIPSKRPSGLVHLGLDLKHLASFKYIRDNGEMFERTFLTPAIIDCKKLFPEKVTCVEILTLKMKESFLSAELGQVSAGFSLENYCQANLNQHQFCFNNRLKCYETLTMN